MSSVQPSPEYDLAVVPYRPYYTFVRNTLCVFLVILFALASYYSGFYRATSAQQAAVEERDRLKVVYENMLQENKQLTQNIANLTLGSQVDRKATEQVRAEVVELKNRIAELERDNTFYRDLMRPESDDQGISIPAPAITQLIDDNLSNESEVYEYKLVVKQLASNRLQVSGYLEFMLVGTNAEGKAQRFSLHEVSEAQSLQKIKLNFRYFQRIEGKMVLPKTFKPSRIELKLVSLKPKKALIEKKFNWTIQESE